MMQIRELVLYGYNGKVRHLPFALGKVNIITGRSKSGKSAIGDIIDYCMGGDSCNIADGIVRDNKAVEPSFDHVKHIMDLALAQIKGQYMSFFVSEIDGHSFVADINISVVFL